MFKQYVRKLIGGTAWSLLALPVYAQGIDAITQRVTQTGKAFPQEKVFLHLDNSNYFVGDTIWYKAYVTRSDNGMPTNLSKIAYVELLTPDGFLVERQQIPLENDTTGHGNFVLTDSLYGGFYEIRAYTRWMLNFGRIEPEKVPMKHGLSDYFFNEDALKDYYVDYDKLYSRVFPVYNKPAQPGDYQHFMTVRPMRRYTEEKKGKPNLKLSFFPEGGNLVAGTDCRVAYELTDEQQQKLRTEIRITGPGQETVLTTSPTERGRGCFLLKGIDSNAKYQARFQYGGYDYVFDLPKVETQGCALQTVQQDSVLTVSIQTRGLQPGEQLGLHIQQNGLLKVNRSLDTSAGQDIRLEIPLRELPTGVHQITLFNGQGRIYAERLIFVNHGEYNSPKVQISGLKKEYAPFEPIEMTLSVEAEQPAHLSLAIRDNGNNLPSYDNGNILTEMLLGSELKGFIEYPGYYFEKQDSTHRAELDLLMMVQGWRRYKWTRMAGVEPFAIQYLPEKYQTLAGRLYRDFGINRDKSYDRREALERYLEIKKTDEKKAEDYLKKNYNTISKPAIVKADYAQDTLVMETEQVTDNGYFYMTTPRFFGKCVLFLSATDSVRNEQKDEKPGNLKRWIKNKMERINGFANEEAFPEYYVKRDLFFPNHCKPYSFYQDNIPDEEEILTVPDGSIQLENIEVSGKKLKGLRKIDRSKPALVVDAYEAFNKVLDLGLVQTPRYYQEVLKDTTDEGLGTVDMLSKFPFAYTGDYGTNYLPQVEVEFNDKLHDNIGWGGEGKLESYRYLKYMKEFRIFTDFAPRERGNDSYAGSNTPVINFQAIQYNDNSYRNTYRDRYIILDGFAECDAFYNPDYSNKPLPDSKDYRRTLYWNPQIHLQPGETKQIRCYNNSQKTEIAVEAEGITDGGTLLTNQTGKQ